MGTIEQLETAVEAKRRSPKNPLVTRRIVDAIGSQATSLEPSGPDSAQLLALLEHGGDGVRCPQHRAPVRGCIFWPCTWPCLPLLIMDQRLVVT